MVAEYTKILLSVSHPDVAAQWHPERNGEITASQIVAGSHKKYWWVCPEGPDHEWQAAPGDRTVWVADVRVAPE